MQDQFTPGAYGSPAPPTGPKKAYINDEGSFFLAGPTGTATYMFDGEAYYSHLKFVGVLV